MTIIICPKCEGDGFDQYDGYTDYMASCTLCDGKGVYDQKESGLDE